MEAFRIHLPRFLHARIGRLAEREGISVHEFILLAAAEKAALLEAEGMGLDCLAARAARAEQREADPRQVFRDYVAGAADVEPVPEDRLEEAD